MKKEKNHKKNSDLRKSEKLIYYHIKHPLNLKFINK